MRTKTLAVAIMLALGATGVQGAQAAGCLSGGAVGAVAGHVAGHHAVLGAVGGCVVGHEINKHDQKVQAQKAAQAQSAQAGSGKPMGN